MNKPHKPGIHEACLVTRKLLLAGLDDDKAALLSSALADFDGIDSAALDRRRSRLRVVYDAARIDIDALERLVRECGLSIDDSRWARIKEGWYRFVDENVRDNFRSQPRGCHHPPPGL
ncbi:MAG: hypothetical protein VX836_19815 [Pseudomonadota bacterium]|nr:hypothetical protein [Nevskiales bacterium]MEC9360105.1 hypothetical protein [Pseudomonadota bacterium]